MESKSGRSTINFCWQSINRHSSTVTSVLLAHTKGETWGLKIVISIMTRQESQLFFLVLILLELLFLNNKNYQESASCSSLSCMACKMSLIDKFLADPRLDAGSNFSLSQSKQELQRKMPSSTPIGCPVAIAAASTLKVSEDSVTSSTTLERTSKVEEGES